MRNSYSCCKIICNNAFHNIFLLHVTSSDIWRGAALICGHSFRHHKKCYKESLDITPLYHFIFVRSLEGISKLKGYVFLTSLVICRLCSMAWQLYLTTTSSDPTRSFLPGTVFPAWFWAPWVLAFLRYLQIWSWRCIRRRHTQCRIPPAAPQGRGCWCSRGRPGLRWSPGKPIPRSHRSGPGPWPSSGIWPSVGHNQSAGWGGVWTGRACPDARSPGGYDHAGMWAGKKWREACLPWTCHFVGAYNVRVGTNFRCRLL